MRDPQQKLALLRHHASRDFRTFSPRFPSPIPDLQKPSYSTDVNNLEQIREATSDTPPVIDGSKTLDRENIRSVIEVYVAAALQGDQTTAASVAIVQGKPADPKQIEPQLQAISRSLNLKQLDMQSIYLNDWEHPTGALAISESVTHAEKQRNGERAGFVMLELKRIEEDWFVIGVEFRTKDAAHEKLTQFLEANPKSIDLPPLTPNSLPQRNSVEPVDGMPKGASENNEKTSLQDSTEASPEEQPLDRKNTPAEADGDSNSELVPEQSRSAGQAMSQSMEAVEVQTQQILDRWRKHSESIDTLAVEWKQTTNYSAGSLEGKELRRIDDGGHSFPEKTTEATNHCRVVIKGESGDMRPLEINGSRRSNNLLPLTILPPATGLTAFRSLGWTHPIANLLARRSYITA